MNTSRPYDDDLLARYDVLIIKTPEEPIPDAESAAIDRFVRAGGGLLLVGDHTNLLGMGTHLNALCARYGIRFRYDSVSDGLTGGFVDYDGPRLGRHVGALHVDRLEFMTSCSLQLSGAAETILAAEDCQREPHDYSGSSFFGRRGPHPEMDQGRTVLAATVRVGLGRIAAFTDSTVWSSFAVFSHDREKLAMDLVRLLNREPSGYEVPVRCVAVAAALLAVLLGLSMVGSGMALPALLFLLVGSWAGVAVSEAIHRRVYAWPAPNAPISEVTFLWQGGVLRVSTGSRNSRVAAGGSQFRHIACCGPAPWTGVPGCLHLRRRPPDARDSGHVCGRPAQQSPLANLGPAQELRPRWREPDRPGRRPDR